MRPIGAAAVLSLGLAGAAIGQIASTPPFTIWDAEPGKPVSQIPEREVVELSCGTNGGPPSLGLSDPGNFRKCPPEESGLREVYFQYDDEREYIAKARENEYKVNQRGTSVYAHPVIVSVLVDDDGIVQGRRIVTDPRVSKRARRRAASLMRNFKARYGPVGLDCRDVPPKEGEKPIGNLFVHEICTGQRDQIRYRLESTYLRKPGQRAVNRTTQQPNASYFESRTRVETVRAPYMPAKPERRPGR